MGITDPFGGIDKAKARKLGYEVLPGDAWIEQESTSCCRRPSRTRSPATP